MDERFMEQAAEIERLHRENAISLASQSTVEHSQFFDGVHCIEDDCGEEIPAERLALGKIRCVECQTRRENPHAH